jgi:uncharacterized protein YkwD
MRNKFHFVLGFVLGAIIFGSSVAIANTIVANATINRVIINGNETMLSSNNIRDNNYFKLRDLGAAMGFSVAWDSQKSAIIINTSKPYSEVNSPPAMTPPTDMTASVSPPVPAMSIDEMKAELIRLTNEERTNKGVSTLKVLPELMQTAQLKADDMKKNSYYGHNSPVYGTAGDLIFSYVPNAKYYAENIAPWNKTPEDVFSSLVNSERHYAALIDVKHTHIGVGIVEGAGGGYWWVQHFVEL